MRLQMVCTNPVNTYLFVSICTNGTSVSGFDHPHVSENISDSKVPLWRAKSKVSGFASRIHRACGRKAYPQKKRIRIQKYLDTCGRGLRIKYTDEVSKNMYILSRYKDRLSPRDVLHVTNYAEERSAICFSRKSLFYGSNFRFSKNQRKQR